MPYFVVYAIDHTDAAGLRQDHRPQHRARLRDPGEHAVKVHIGGPLLNEAGEMNGTMLVVQAAEQDTVRRFVQDDPYTKAGLYRHIDIHPFNWGLGQPKEQTNG